MKKIYLQCFTATLLVGGVIISELQAQQFCLPNHIATEGNDCFNRRITVDPNNGSFAVAGDICGTLDVDLPLIPNTISMSEDMGSYLIKHDECGDVVWENVYDCIRIIDMDMDSRGDIYITGHWHYGCGTVPFGGCFFPHGAGIAQNSFFIGKINGSTGACIRFDLYAGPTNSAEYSIGSALSIDKTNDDLYLAATIIAPSPIAMGVLHSGGINSISETTIFKVDNPFSYPFNISSFTTAPSPLEQNGGGIAQIEYYDNHLYAIGWEPTIHGTGPRMSGDANSKVFVMESSNLTNIISDYDFDANAFNLKVWPSAIHGEDRLFVCGVFEDNATIAPHSVSGSVLHGFVAAWDITTVDSTTFNSALNAIDLPTDPWSGSGTGVIPFSMAHGLGNMIVSAVGSTQFMYAFDDGVNLEWDLFATTPGMINVGTGISYGNDLGSQRSADIAFQDATLEDQKRFVFVGNNNDDVEMYFDGTAFNDTTQGFANNNTYVIGLYDAGSAGNWLLQSEGFQENPKISIYPNPSTGLFYIFSPDDSFFTLTDLQGKTLFKKHFSKGENTIDLRHLPSGMYLLSNSESRFKINISK
ncbi:MAG: T9SS type A sorting domain-containing protein [Cryomorphaceae bacterium]|nr:T9SS type A sorting domain-containing protein [Cryomorphaceae bacterium]